ncbi:MAG: transposase [Emticicia sp.]|nr:transposase [Emticicia sp.]
MAKIRHLLDRGHDDQTVFEHITSLGSDFVIRAKANRNSDEFRLNEKNKKKYIKLLDASLEKSYTQCLVRFVWKNKLYPQAQINITQGSVKLNQQTYQILRVQVFDRHKKPIFKDSMLLITNELCDNFETCFELYQAYLRRSKIENVFKFLKNNLGWETFRVRDFIVIQNLISLCFFVAGYFYEHQKEIVNDEKAKFICSLAKSKGKVSKHFYLEGLKIMANYLLFQQAVKEQNIPQDTVNELIRLIK